MEMHAKLLGRNLDVDLIVIVIMIQFVLQKDSVVNARMIDNAQKVNSALLDSNVLNVKVIEIVEV